MEDWIYHRDAENTEWRIRIGRRTVGGSAGRPLYLLFDPYFFPELCVSVVNPILRALFLPCALPLPLAAGVGFLYNRRVRSTEFRYGFAFQL
jgi:hypothetical protein